MLNVSREAIDHNKPSKDGKQALKEGFSKWDLFYPPNE
jgi:hypothetical protein